MENGSATLQIEIFPHVFQRAVTAKRTNNFCRMKLQIFITPHDAACLVVVEHDLAVREAAHPEGAVRPAAVEGGVRQRHLGHPLAHVLEQPVSE